VRQFHDAHFAKSQSGPEKVRGSVSQKRDVRPRLPFIRISQARSGTLIQIPGVCGHQNQSV